MTLNPPGVLEKFSDHAREQLLAEAFLKAQRLKEEQRQRAAADAVLEAAAADTGDLKRLDWLKRHRGMIWPDVALDLEDRAFLIGIYADEAPHLVMKKSGQMCISDWAIRKAPPALHGADPCRLAAGSDRARNFTVGDLQHDGDVFHGSR